MIRTYKGREEKSMLLIYPNMIRTYRGREEKSMLLIYPNMIRTYRGREVKSMLLHLEHDPNLQGKRGNIHVPRT